jgi:hypothetical protein
MGAACDLPLRLHIQNTHSICTEFQVGSGANCLTVVLIERLLAVLTNVIDTLGCKLISCDLIFSTPGVMLYCGDSVFRSWVVVRVCFRGVMAIRPLGDLSFQILISGDGMHHVR